MTTRNAIRPFAVFATGAFILVALMGVTAAQQAAAPTIKAGTYQALVSVEGKDSFLAYCAVCHGIDGKGGGPAVPALKGPVPDLTTMAKRYGKFNTVAIEQQIAGLDKMPAAHGSMDMPMWGPIFRSQDADQVAKMRVRNLATYLGSLQAK